MYPRSNTVNLVLWGLVVGFLSSSPVTWIPIHYRIAIAIQCGVVSLVCGWVLPRISLLLYPLIAICILSIYESPTLWSIDDPVWINRIQRQTLPLIAIGAVVCIARSRSNGVRIATACLLSMAWPHLMTAFNVWRVPHLDLDSLRIGLFTFLLGLAAAPPTRFSSSRGGPAQLRKVEI